MNIFMNHFVHNEIFGLRTSPLYKIKKKELTSSNFLQINVNALKIAFLEPITVTIRSGHEPSDMFILAPL